MKRDAEDGLQSRLKRAKAVEASNKVAEKPDKVLGDKKKERLRLWKEKQQGLEKSQVFLPKNGGAADDDMQQLEEKARKQERLKAWKEKRNKNVADIEKTDKECPVKKPLFNLDEDVPIVHVPEDSDEIDPLDAYMQSIESVTALDLDMVVSINDRDVSQRAITLEEILNGAKEEDEEKDYQEVFLQEMKKKREDDEEIESRAQLLLKQELEEQYHAIKESGKELSKGDVNTGLGLIVQGDGDHDEALGDAGIGPSALELLQERIRKKDLKQVDHSKIMYPPFRRSFYQEAITVKQASPETVKALRAELEMVVRGSNPPGPITSWSEAGLSERTLTVLEKRGWEAPFAIQRQALPAMMSGRDLIGVAKTGSGKTLAFVLPMLRHVLDQPRVGRDEGPIALVLAPARELAVQIHSEIKKFNKALSLGSACCYGGAGIKEQIAALKGGVEVVVATPGRLIDLLTTNSGRVIPLNRVTMVILDEADRMFDMGFEPQVMKIVNNTRPDRQIAMFSATFPPQVERVAKELLKHKPLIVVVGGHSKASGDIKQIVEVREPTSKFPRLLQLLGEWYLTGNILVFVKSQDRCDKLFQELIKVGYRCLSLHGGKDQFDRDSTIQDFKEKRETLLIATSVAGRGLDVPDLNLVVNYDVPSHLEDYIHRCGRTGRAGRQGTAYTFISNDEAQFAPDLVKALKDAKQMIPDDLQQLNLYFREKIAKGEAKFRNSGYRGSGFSFEENEKTDIVKQQDLLRKQQEVQMGLRDADEPTPKPASPTTADNVVPSNESKDEVIQRARRLALSMSTESAITKSAFNTPIAAFTKQIEINQYPQQARWKITNKESLKRIQDDTTASITGKGVYLPPGRNPNPGEQPLFLQVDANSEYALIRAVNEINRILEQAVLEIGLGGSKSSAKYSVL